MRWRVVRVVLGSLTIALALVGDAPPASAAHIRELRVIGEGAIVAGASSCWDTALIPGCTITATGEITEMTGAILGQGTFRLELKTSAGPAQPNADQGWCLIANRSANVPQGAREQWVTLTAADGALIFLSTVGTFCEELGPGASYQYVGAFRIEGSKSTGRLANAVGGGSLTATIFRAGSGTVTLQLHGTIRY